MTPELTSDKGFLRALWEALFESPANKVPSSPIETVKTDLGALPLTENQLRELDWHQTTAVGPVKIECLPARHFSGRLFKRRNTLWASFMVTLPDGMTVYIGGDSGYGKHYRQIAQRYSTVDYAILEDGQYNED